MFLLTSHGTVICTSEDTNKLAHFRADRIEPGFIPIDFGELPGSIGSDYKDFLELPPPSAEYRPDNPVLSDFIVTRTKDLRTFKVVRDDFCMTALPNGGLGFHSKEAKSWELYIGLSTEDFENINFIFANTWIENTTGEFILPENIFCPLV